MFKVQVFGSAHFHLSPPPALPPSPPFPSPNHSTNWVEWNKTSRSSRRQTECWKRFCVLATNTTFSSSTSLDFGQSVLCPFDACRDKSGMLLQFPHKPVTTACTTVHFFWYCSILQVYTDAFSWQQRHTGR